MVFPCPWREGEGEGAVFDEFFRWVFSKLPPFRLSPCDGPFQFATRGVTYGSNRAVPERRRDFLRKSSGRRTFPIARRRVWFSLLRKEAGFIERRENADPGRAFQNHCRGAELRRSCARVRQAHTQGTAFLVESADVPAARRRQN